MKTRNMRKVLLVLVLGILVLGGGYAGYRGYKSMRQAHLIKQAQHYLTQPKPDARKALLCLERVLRSNPLNVEATRMLAALLEAGRSPGALLWRSRVVELNPRSLDDRLALAQSAMMFRDYATATNALGGVDPAGKKTVAYHNVAGAVAAGANQTALAEAQFLEAAMLDPQNQSVQLNLAVVRLHGTNLPAINQARDSLRQLSSNSTNSFLRCQALRELASDALRHRQGDQALLLSKRLLQETNSTFKDRLLQLEVLQQAQPAGFRPALTAFQHEAGDDTGKIYELATWQIANTSPQDALAWLRTLPSNMQTNQSVELLAAECFSTLRDWRGLQSFIEKQNWAELEFVRHAFLSRALRGQELVDSAKAEWELALKAANGQKEGLVMLLRLAIAWNWQTEGEDTLWVIVNRFPGEQSAIQSLSQALYAGGRTRSLMQLFGQESKRVPSDLSMKNNLAMTALLLDAQEHKPYDLAREVYQKAPTNSSYVSTYAFSLYLQGKNAEALKVIKTLKPQQLQDPAIAGYYGLILKATGDRARARAYLDWTSKARLLPEEKKLFDKAKAGL